MSATFTAIPNINSLCPGYKHVEEFGADDEYEDEDVEEFYVTLDLGSAEPTLIPSSSTYRLVGLDTPTPFMQLSGTVLQGKYENLLGTELFFTESKDNQDRTKRHLSYVSATSQRIRFREVLLRPKAPSASADASTGTATSDVEMTGPSTSSPAKQGGAPNQTEYHTDDDSTTMTTSAVNRMTGKSEPRKRRRSKMTSTADTVSNHDAASVDRAPGKQASKNAKDKDQGIEKEKVIVDDEEEEAEQTEDLNATNSVMEVDGEDRQLDDSEDDLYEGAIVLDEQMDVVESEIPSRRPEAMMDGGQGRDSGAEPDHIEHGHESDTGIDDLID
ncbi:hypothetical protein D9757_013193 [Collybiopsis confluens]|uniref:Transcription factor TFIIIC triple barrel domain-containing protein n=1 Tax=Collybiopsis confluens TaxID=2823264 RepID=A0A8H5D180_9AGAR|nr:hypothetical protein D9757_013193 [Collybiopsis confluens]